MQCNGTYYTVDTRGVKMNRYVGPLESLYKSLRFGYNVTGPQIQPKFCMKFPPKLIWLSETKKPANAASSWPHSFSRLKAKLSQKPCTFSCTGTCTHTALSTVPHSEGWPLPRNWDKIKFITAHYRVCGRRLNFLRQFWWSISNKRNEGIIHLFKSRFYSEKTGGEILIVWIIHLNHVRRSNTHPLVGT